jgi:LPXTG-motif cell wall-anchored protein
MVAISVMGAFADTYNGETDKRCGQLIFEDKIIQEYVAPVDGKPEVPEEVEWSAEEVSNDLNNALKKEVVLTNLDYIIVIKTKMGNIKLGEWAGTLEQIEGDQTIEVKYKVLGKTTITSFVFKVIKTITQEFIPAVEEIKEVPEITNTYALGYEYVCGKHKGCRVLFSKTDIVTHIKTTTAKGTEDEKIVIKKTNSLKRLSRINYICGKSYKWVNGGFKVWKTIYLYRHNNWTCPETPVETTSTETTSTTPVETISTTPETTPTTITSADNPTTTETVVESNNEGLPKTGESSPLKYILIGLTIIAIGTGSLYFYNKKVTNN